MLQITMSWTRVRGNTIFKFNIISAVDVDVLMCIDCIHNGLINRPIGRLRQNVRTIQLLRGFEAMVKLGYSKITKIGLVYSKIVKYILNGLILEPLVADHCHL